MFGTLKGRIVVILAVLAVAGWYLYQNRLTLGLDLQGGMHLVLEVADPEGTMTPEARADATERALHIIRTRIDEFGVEEPLVQKSGDDRIIVELPGVDDEERAKAIIERTAFLEFKLVRDGQSFREALPRIDRAVIQALGPDAIPAPRDEPREELPELLFGPRDTAPDPEQDPEAETPEEAAQEEDLDAVPEGRPFSGLLLETGVEGEFMVPETDVPVLREYLALQEVQRVLPRGVSLAFAQHPETRGAQVYRTLFVLEDRAFMTGESLVDASAGRDPQWNRPVVYFELDRRGGNVFGRVTGENIGERIAILLDGDVVSAPVIRSQIRSRGQIELGAAPMTEARDLALVLRAGALPAPLEILEERTVGPSLGADSIERGKWAGIVGLLLVVGIIAGYYRVAGLLAIGALAAYALMVLGGLAGFNATLTVPGIAGLILSIGMAVDANVLIFERIREELRAGRTPRTAVDEGFRHAMSAIVDSNLTTLMTALILFQFGTGPVRGFAVTLSIGIIASFFTAVYITRTLFLLYMERKRATDPISI